MNPNIPQEPPIVIKCIKCGFDFACYNKYNSYFNWCDDCFCDTPIKERYPATTPQELVEITIRQEKTRQSLKQRALDKKNRVEKTAGKKKTSDNDDNQNSSEDFLIFNEPSN